MSPTNDFEVLSSQVEFSAPLVLNMSEWLKNVLAYRDVRKGFQS